MSQMPNKKTVYTRCVIEFVEVLLSNHLCTNGFQAIPKGYTPYSIYSQLGLLDSSY